MKFTVLMTIYNREKSENYDRALKSVLIDQTVFPDQFVLVYDGPVGDEIKAVTEKYKNLYKGEFDVIELSENSGQGKASKAGIRYCHNEFIARMDSDDISISTRFEEEISVFRKMPDIDVVAGWITEFIEKENNIDSIRTTPETHEEIVTLFKKRNPVNNVTVMYKKSILEIAGGYTDERGNEDFGIYCRMLIKGARFYNIQKPLVKVRTGSDMVLRRGNIEIYRGWKKNQKILYNGGIINKFEYLRNCLCCYLFVKSPASFKKLAYKYVLRRKNNERK